MRFPLAHSYSLLVLRQASIQSSFGCELSSLSLSLAFLPLVLGIVCTCSSEFPAFNAAHSACQSRIGLFALSLFLLFASLETIECGVPHSRSSRFLLPVFASRTWDWFFLFFLPSLIIASCAFQSRRRRSRCSFFREPRNNRVWGTSLLFLSFPLAFFFFLFFLLPPSLAHFKI